MHNKNLFHHVWKLETESTQGSLSSITNLERSYKVFTLNSKIDNVVADYFTIYF